MPNQCNLPSSQAPATGMNPSNQTQADVQAWQAQWTLNLMIFDHFSGFGNHLYFNVPSDTFKLSRIFPDDTLDF